MSPTRKLSMQTYGILKELMKHHCHTYGSLTDNSKQAEAQKLEKGIFSWYEYIHHVRRITRGDSSVLLILRPEELGFLNYLKEARVPEREFFWNKIIDIQLQLTEETIKDYVRTYDSRNLNQIFNIETLNLAKVAKSFGFTAPPAVNLKEGFIITKEARRKYKRPECGKAAEMHRHQIDKCGQDNRQFSR